jgi:hypothetical protein
VIHLETGSFSCQSGGGMLKVVTRVEALAMEVEVETLRMVVALVVTWLPTWGSV